MARRTLKRVAVAEIHGMLEPAVRRPDRLPRERLVQRGVAYCTIIPDHLALFAPMLAVMAAEAALCVEVADIIDVARPIRLHLREKVCLIDPLHLCHGCVNHISAGVE
jgi:hypothetical protein